MGNKGEQGKEFKKRHGNYNKGKPVDEDLFFACLDLFLLNRMNLDSACTMIGLSRPTLQKRWNAVLMGEEIPATWFLTAEDNYLRKKILQKVNTIVANLQRGKRVVIYVEPSKADYLPPKVIIKYTKNYKWSRD